jgi:hypothetical protein
LDKKWQKLASQHANKLPWAGAVEWMAFLPGMPVQAVYEVDRQS